MVTPAPGAPGITGWAKDIEDLKSGTTFRTNLNATFVAWAPEPSGDETGVTDAAAIQSAIDSLITNTDVTSVSEAPITVPKNAGGTVRLHPGVYHIDEITLKDMVRLAGDGVGRTQVIVHGDGIQYATVFDTAFYTVWGVGIRDMRITGATGAETLLGPGVVTDVTKNRTEHTLTEAEFTRVLFERAHVGVEVRGWNNDWSTCWFRDLDIAVQANTSAKRSEPNTLVANPGDNNFLRCTFNDTDVSFKAQHAKGQSFINCAFYRADDVHLWFGEGCNGNLMVGGRLEDGINALARFDGADLVNVEGTIYQAVATHTSGATNEPGEGASWEDYWAVTTDWSTERTWVSGKTYVAQGAIGNTLQGVDLYIGAASRTGRGGATVNRSANYRAVILDGDQHTRIRDCWSGATTSEQVQVTDRSASAVLTDNTSVRAEWVGDGTASYSEVYQAFGSPARVADHDISLVKLRKLRMKGETEDYYWTYGTGSPRTYIFRGDTHQALQVRESSGVLHLPSQAFITTLNTGSTNTVVSVANVSTTDVVMLTPRTAAAATAYAAGNIYAVPEANDKIRIYHPSGLAAGCTFNVLLI